MLDNLISNLNNYYQENILEYVNTLYQYPVKLIALVLDLAIVIFLIYFFIKTTKKSRVMQLLKGILLYIVITALSSLLNLQILNFILTSVLSYGVIAIIVIFQPELRRGLEQLGSNKITKFIGMQKDIMVKTKENIYKVIIAVEELSKTKTRWVNCFRKRYKD